MHLQTNSSVAVLVYDMLISSQIAVENAKEFDLVIFAGHNSKPIEQRLWPTHCIQKSTGAELHTDLQVGKKCVLNLMTFNVGISN